jgi:hypothetical protein
VLVLVLVLVQAVARHLLLALLTSISRRFQT